MFLKNFGLSEKILSLLFFFGPTLLLNAKEQPVFHSEISTSSTQNRELPKKSYGSCGCPKKIAAAANQQVSEKVDQKPKHLIEPYVASKELEAFISQSYEHASDETQKVWRALEIEGTQENDEEHGAKILSEKAHEAVKQLWTLEEGTGLKEGLEGWGESSGFKVIWRASCDYDIRAPIQILGTLEEAMAKLMEAYGDAEQPLRSDLYPLQSLIVISNF